MSSLGDQRHILNPHATLAGNIGSGFNGDYHPGLQLGFLTRCQARRFMNLQSHSVTGGMGEVATPTCILQDCARRPIYLFRRNSRVQPAQRACLPASWSGTWSFFPQAGQPKAIMTVPLRGGLVARIVAVL